jgi:uncharacterized coiled-coil protein SlyX
MSDKDDQILAAIGRLSEGLEARITGLEARITGLEATMTGMAAKMTSLRVELMARMERLQDAFATMKDDHTVTNAIVQRIDSNVTGLTREIRVTHAQVARLNRVTAIEDRGGAAAH